MYTKPVSDTIQRHGLSHHSYADDTQLYMTMDHSNNDWRDSLARIELCVSEIREWMNQNMLKLNDDKTELIVCTSKYKQELYNDLSITIGDTVVDCSSQVRDLVVIFDRVLSLRKHVSYTSKTCRFHLRVRCCCCCLPTLMTLDTGGSPMLLLLSTHSPDPCMWVGESDHPTVGPPASLFLHLASSSITLVGSVNKSRGDNVMRM